MVVTAFAYFRALRTGGITNDYEEYARTRLEQHGIRNVQQKEGLQFDLNLCHNRMVISALRAGLVGENGHLMIRYDPDAEYVAGLVERVMRGEMPFPEDRVVIPMKDIELLTRVSVELLGFDGDAFYKAFDDAGPQLRQTMYKPLETDIKKIWAQLLLFSPLPISIVARPYIYHGIDYERDVDPLLHFRSLLSGLECNALPRKKIVIPSLEPQPVQQEEEKEDLLEKRMEEERIAQR